MWSSSGERLRDGNGIGLCYHIVIPMVEVQQSITNFLMHMDQAGVLVGLVLGFVLGLMTALLIFYQAVVRA